MAETNQVKLIDMGRNANYLESDDELEEEENADLNQCRFCSEKTIAKNTIDLYGREAKQAMLLEKCHRTLPLLVVPNDKLPKFGCVDCVSELIRLDKFVRKCLLGTKTMVQKLCIANDEDDDFDNQILKYIKTFDPLYPKVKISDLLSENGNEEDHDGSNKNKNKKRTLEDFLREARTNKRARMEDDEETSEFYPAQKFQLSERDRNGLKYVAKLDLEDKMNLVLKTLPLIVDQSHKIDKIDKRISSIGKGGKSPKVVNLGGKQKKTPRKEVGEEEIIGSSEDDLDTYVPLEVSLGGDDNGVNQNFIENPRDRTGMSDFGLSLPLQTVEDMEGFFSSLNPAWETERESMLKRFNRIFDTSKHWNVVGKIFSIAFAPTLIPLLTWFEEGDRKDTGKNYNKVPDNFINVVYETMDLDDHWKDLKKEFKVRVRRFLHNMRRNKRDKNDGGSRSEKREPEMDDNSQDTYFDDYDESNLDLALQLSVEGQGSFGNSQIPSSSGQGSSSSGLMSRPRVTDVVFQQEDFASLSLPLKSLDGMEKFFSAGNPAWQTERESLLHRYYGILASSKKPDAIRKIFSLTFSSELQTIITWIEDGDRKDAGKNYYRVPENFINVVYEALDLFPEWKKIKEEFKYRARVFLHNRRRNAKKEFQKKEEEINRQELESMFGEERSPQSMNLSMEEDYNRSMQSPVITPRLMGPGVNNRVQLPLNTINEMEWFFSSSNPCWEREKDILLKTYVDIFSDIQNKNYFKKILLPTFSADILYVVTWYEEGDRQDIGGNKYHRLPRNFINVVHEALDIVSPSMPEWIEVKNGISRRARTWLHNYRRKMNGSQKVPIKVENIDEDDAS